jgi:hypothetical protein
MVDCEMSIVQRILGNCSVETALSRVAPPDAGMQVAHVVRGFIREGEAEELRQHLIRKILNEGGDPEISWAATRYQIFNDEHIISLSEKARDFVECVSGIHAEFSYNYSAIYPENCHLTPHFDREGCDYNFLLFLGESNFSTSQTDIIDLRLLDGWKIVSGKPGDAVIFEGRKTLHARRGSRPSIDFATTLLHYISVPSVTPT